MGNGRSKISKNGEVIPVDSYDDEEIGVDIDTELNTSLRDKYEEDRINFHMTAEELDDYLRQHEDVVHVVYDSDFYYFSGKENVGELIEEGPREGRVLINDEDLRYSVYSMVDAIVKIQEAYTESTGDTARLVKTLHVGSYIEDWEDGTRGFAESTYITIDYNKGTKFQTSIDERTSDITIDARSDVRLKKSNVEALRNGTLQNNKDDSTLNFLIERNLFNNGWFSVAGFYQRSTLTHEMGHALKTRYYSYREDLSKVDYDYKYRGINALNRKITNWFYNTRSSPVSGYSQKDFNEAFAECFNLFIHGGKSTSKMYKEFVNDIVPELEISNMYGILK